MRRIVQEGRVRLIQPVRYSVRDDAPTVEIQIAGGTAVWRQNSTEVEVCVKDGEDAYGFSSGLRSVTCYTGRQIVAKRTWEYEGEQVLSETLRFKVAQSSSGGSPVPVTVHVSDRAGNTAVLTERLYLDFHPPEAEISGVRSGMIAGECRKAVFTLKDENILKDAALRFSGRGLTGQRRLSWRRFRKTGEEQCGKKELKWNFQKMGNMYVQ